MEHSVRNSNNRLALSSLLAQLLSTTTQHHSTATRFTHNTSIAAHMYGTLYVWDSSSRALTAIHSPHRYGTVTFFFAYSYCSRKHRAVWFCTNTIGFARHDNYFPRK